ALLAVMTAYVRTLGRSLGAPADFQGPMAKPHRMMVVMVACLLTPFETIFLPPGAIFLLALLVIIGGCVMTLWRRAQTAYLYLEGRTDV
ncbi:MAG: CDP-alcohol phosphatidyltransferase family protein, partial [Alphaproteobacteria bacterium]|nr:CDP-alcohol phosphatidyltransferase family protein [Alphaproteobacteria bacterium]